MSNKRIKINETYVPLLNNTARQLIVYGGAGSGKSHFIAQKIVLRCLAEPGSKFLCLRKVGATIKESIYALIKQVLIDFGVYHEWKDHKGSHEFYHPNGSCILTSGLDEPEKIKSIAGITSIWMEEATEFTYIDYTQLLLRIRGQLPPGVKYVQYILSFNPISEYHWLKLEVIDKIDKFDDIDYIHTTYLNNHFVDEQYAKQLKRLQETNPLYYQIYCLGDWGVEDKSGKFAWAFDREKHVKEQVDWRPNDYTYLSFDFNVNPICCTVIQWDGGKRVTVPQCIKLADSNIYNLCDYIKAKYHGALFIVTGDATGTARSAMVKDGINYYTIIKDKLNLLDTQIQVPSVNPSLVENKVLVNAVLQTMEVEIAKQDAEGLIFDLAYVEVNEDNTLKKQNRADEKQKADALDTFRYFCNVFLRHVLKV